MVFAGQSIDQRHQRLDRLEQEGRLRTVVHRRAASRPSRPEDACMHHGQRCDPSDGSTSNSCVSRCVNAHCSESPSKRGGLSLSPGTTGDMPCAACALESEGRPRHTPITHADAAEASLQQVVEDKEPKATAHPSPTARLAAPSAGMNRPMVHKRGFDATCAIPHVAPALETSRVRSPLPHRSPHKDVWQGTPSRSGGDSRGLSAHMVGGGESATHTRFPVCTDDDVTSYPPPPRPHRDSKSPRITLHRVTGQAEDSPLMGDLQPPVPPRRNLPSIPRANAMDAPSELPNHASQRPREADLKALDTVPYQQHPRGNHPGSFYRHAHQTPGMHSRPFVAHHPVHGELSAIGGMSTRPRPSPRGIVMPFYVAPLITPPTANSVGLTGC